MDKEELKAEVLKALSYYYDISSIEEDLFSISK